MVNSDLPDNVLHNILTRLPSKPLFRSRCVSKHWNRLMSDPFFMNSRSRRKILVSTSSLDLHLIDDNVPVTDDMNHSIVNLPNSGDHTGATVVGSFNGIVLLVFSGTTDMILYNPLTRASKKVPDPPCRYNYQQSSYAFGFGYGATTPDDLKIVKTQVHSDGLWANFQEFDLKTSVWSRPQCFDPWYAYYESKCGVFLNGYLYWVASIILFLEPVIVAYNVEKRVSSRIYVPDGCEDMSKNLLGIVNGYLCMMCLEYDEYNVWVMKKGLQGVKNSWSKAYSFNIHLHSYPSCIYILDQGKYLMVDSYGKFYIHDTSKKHQCEPRLIHLNGDNCYQVHGIEYAESLIPPSDILGKI